jgi:uncharacterized RDD family membrane protein YckC
MDGDWYYLLAGQQIGPVSVQTLARLAREGVLHRETLVWRKGMNLWTMADQIEGIIRAWPPDELSATARPASTDVQHAQQASPSPRFAGFWDRLAAYLIDACLSTVSGIAFGFLCGAILANVQMTERAVGTSASLLGFLLYWFYFAGFESSRLGATPGKRALQLRVTDLGGRRISFARATGRLFGKLVSAVPLGAGFVAVAFTKQKQALHDIMAGSLVLDVRPGTAAPQAEPGFLRHPLSTVAVSLGLLYGLVEAPWRATDLSDPGQTGYLLGFVLGAGVGFPVLAAMPAILAWACVGFRRDRSRVFYRAWVITTGGLVFLTLWRGLSSA